MDTLIHYILAQAERTATYKNVDLTGMTKRISAQQATLYALDCFNRLTEREQDDIILNWKETTADREAVV
ncbi:hypothetical protein [Beijerinckia indica]|uniref:Uncharacterized protein n=1 Tax=Beijerinckia indica subsp. indica (strain ATCC 9039 / DSM 1715 / NCIMB 8712) TaxID=395963 RepID=B2IH29_BEII9|nr:hypothetical protein [Beijerinckia indica]ACB94443.1 hypothetical protein Bind_0793 [Beijerinckia indica subsp. indica ATCC 9039]